MSGKELQRFFGVPANADDQTLLGLSGPITIAAVEAAAHRRLEQIRRHPGAGGADSAAAEARIRLAVARLRGRLAAGGARPPAGPATPGSSASGSSASGSSASGSSASGSLASGSLASGPSASGSSASGSSVPAHASSFASKPSVPDRAADGPSAPARTAASPGAASPSTTRPSTASSIPVPAAGSVNRGRSDEPLQLAPDPPSADHFGDLEHAAVLDRRGDEVHAVTGRTMGNAFQGVTRPRPHPDELPPLTPFDRAALGTLVGHGGWNQRSRARLVALASAHGVRAPGLVNVITGLADYARAGSRPAPIAMIADDFTRYTLRDVIVAAPPVPGAESAPPSRDAATELARSLMPELKEAGPVDTAKLVAAVLLPLILLVVVIGRGFTGEVQPPPPLPVDPSISSQVGGGDGSRSEAIRAAAAQRALVFERIPWMQGPPPGPGLLTAADELPTLPGLIEADVVRRLGVRTPPSDATIQRWGASMAEAERGWVRARPSDVRDLRTMAVTGFNATGDRVRLAGRLASFLRPPTSVEAPVADQTPFAWAGAWRMSVLGAVMSEPFSPEGPRQLATDIARESLAPLGTGQTEAGFVAAASGTRAITAAWLELAAQELIDAGDDIGPEPWERWLDAAEAMDADLTVGTLRDRLVAAALERLLRSDRVLSEEGFSADLLGRLMLEVPADMPLVARRTIEAAFVDPGIASDDDLRALTTILALRRDLPWFGESLVLPLSATSATRAEYRDRVASAWPTPPEQDLGGQPIPVDLESLETWMEAVAEVRGRAAAFDDAGRLGRLAEVSQVIESAATLAANRLDESTMAASDVIAAAPNFQGPVERPLSSMTADAIGEPDGTFTAAWDRVKNRGNDAMILLRGLSTRIGSDLGPRDAATLAGIILRPGANRQREMARLMFADDLASGVNTVLAVADRIPTAPVDADLASIVNRVIGSSIVFEREDQWRLEARLALLRHAVDLLEPQEDVLGINQRTYTESINRRVALVRDEVTVDFSAGDPGMAAGRLADAWLRSASTRLSVRPVPVAARLLPDRRAARAGLSTTRLQATAADLIAVIEALAFVTAAEQPKRAPDVAAALERSEIARRETVNVLDQLLAIELAMLEMWEIRFGLNGDASDADGRALGGVAPAAPPADGRGMPERRRGVENPLQRSPPASPGSPDAIPDQRNPGSRPRRAPGIPSPGGRP
ncbi:MAG: hypothetical protein AB8G96_11420 [Phycisphaerales bacterium]